MITKVVVLQQLDVPSYFLTRFLYLLFPAV